MKSPATWTPVKNVDHEVTVGTSYDECDQQERLPDPPPPHMTRDQFVPPCTSSAPPSICSAVFEFPVREATTPRATTPEAAIPVPILKRTLTGIDEDSKRMRMDDGDKSEGGGITEIEEMMDLEGSSVVEEQSRVVPMDSDDFPMENGQMSEIPEDPMNQEKMVADLELPTPPELPIVEPAQEIRKSKRLGEKKPKSEEKSPEPFECKHAEPRQRPLRNVPPRAAKYSRNRKHRPNCHHESRMWFAMTSIECALRGIDLTNFTETSKEVFDKICNDVKEPNCYSYDVPLEEEAPSTDDYRGLTKELDEKVLADPMKFEDIAPNASSTDIPDAIHFTGAPLLDPLTTTSSEVLEAAKLRKNTRENHVFVRLDVKKNKTFFDECSKGVVKEEQEFFDKFRGEEPPPAPGYLPIPIYTVNSKRQMKRLRHLLSSTSMCIVRGLGELIKLNPDDFSISQLADSNPELPVECLRQIPQKATTNNSRLSKEKGKMKGPRQWKCCDPTHYKKLIEFKQYCANVLNLVEKAIVEINDKPEEVVRILDELAKKMKDASMSLDGITGTAKEATMGAFGTNVDLSHEDIWSAQAATIRRFPGFLRPNEGGTLLQFAGEIIAGLNKAQMYLKMAGARTTAHLENNCLASLNYNVGPGDCVWICVPMEYAAEVQKLASKRMLASKIIDEGFWANEEDLIAHGIPVQKFVQRPGDLVYVGVGTFHWVQSNGMATNVSWNIATPTYEQLAVSAACHDYYVANKSKSLMPIETMAWNMATEKAPLDEKIKKFMKYVLMRSLAICQFELDYYAKKSNIFRLQEVKTGDMDLEPVERCGECARALFNNVPVVRIKETHIGKDGKKVYVPADETEIDPETLTFCAHCCAKLKFRRVTVYMRRTIEELAEIFDGFKVTNDTLPTSGGPSSSGATSSSDGPWIPDGYGGYDPNDDVFESDDEGDDPNVPSTSTAHLTRPSRRND